MLLRLRHLWVSLTSGYWFIPCVMLLVAGCGAELLLVVDRHVSGMAALPTWFYGGGPDGATTMLSTIAASVVTVAGVVFSITVAALTQASSQFGPRLLRNFMRDRGNQTVLGVFVATFIYCLLILRTIRRGGGHVDSEFIPQVSITVAVALALASTVFLIYFIHHVSVSLQAPRIVASVRAELGGFISRLPVATAVRPPPHVAGEILPECDEEGDLVVAEEEGYLQAVDHDGLVKLAEESDVILRSTYRPGDYVLRESTLVGVWPRGRMNAALTKRMVRAFICGSDGTAEQDMEYAIRQIVEVAVRALSAGINDPFTAINCIDALSGIVCDISRHELPDRLRRDTQKRPRLLLPVTTFEGIVDLAFNQVRQNSARSPAVMIHLLEVFRRCVDQLSRPQDRAALLRHGDMVHRQAQREMKEEDDRKDADERWAALRGVPAICNRRADRT